MDDEEGSEGAPSLADIREDIAALREDLEEFEDDVERRTVDRETLEAELKRYVRQRQRRGHARGWGPYLVLLYGVVLTMGAFYYLRGLVAIGAMIVVGLSTLGLYVLFVLFGWGLEFLHVPRSAWERFRR